MPLGISAVTVEVIRCLSPPPVTVPRLKPKGWLSEAGALTDVGWENRWGPRVEDGGPGCLQSMEADCGAEGGNMVRTGPTNSNFADGACLGFGFVPASESRLFPVPDSSKLEP